MVKSVTPAGRSTAARWRARVRSALAVGVLLGGTTAAGWVALHRIPGLAPWLADELRSLIGPEAVTDLEDAAYALEDRVNQLRYWGSRPQAHWEVPDPEPAPSEARVPAAASPAREAEPALEAPAARASQRRQGGRFRPEDVGPVHERWSAQGDGRWVPLLSEPVGGEVDAAQAEAPRMYKTLLHPDTKRSWAELFVVAIDLPRVRLHLVAGTREPRAVTEAGMQLERPGHIPMEDHDRVLAAFNGGFKTEHGQYGMNVSGVTLVPPNPAACTIVHRPGLGISIGSWPKMQALLDASDWWRQTPNCMYEDGVMHHRLADGYVHKWGATLKGRTVIRRSAIGLSEDGQTLFVGISNHTTAPAIARGMRHAGAVTVAQLDVNHSYPKFLTYRGSRVSKLRFAVPLSQGFEYSEHEYLRKPSRRDFFYLMPAPSAGRTARN